MVYVLTSDSNVGVACVLSYSKWAWPMVLSDSSIASMSIFPSERGGASGHVFYRSIGVFSLPVSVSEEGVAFAPPSHRDKGVAFVPVSLCEGGVTSL